MKHFISNILLVLFTFLFVPQAHGQALTDVNLNLYSINEGLSGNGITVILQDSKGYIWVGTRDGLNCFDGYSFKEYRHQIGNEKSICGNYISAISEDVNGNLWVATMNSGLSMWNRSEDNFTTYSSKQAEGRKIREDNIYGLFLSNDSLLWFKTTNVLYKLNINSDELQSYGSYSNIFKSGDQGNVPILSPSPNLLWLCNKEGVVQFNVDSTYYQNINISSESEFQLKGKGRASSMLAVDENNIIMSLESGLFNLRKHGESYLLEEIVLPKEYLNKINVIYQCRDESIILGTESGLLAIRFSEEENKYVLDRSLNKTSLLKGTSEVQISDILEDKSGLIWLGTRNRGLLKIDLKDRKFKHISNYTNSQAGFSNYYIKCLHVDDYGFLWIGTKDKGLVKIDLKSNLSYNYKINDEFYKLNKDEVLSICEDSKNRIWLGTSEGVYIYYRDENKIREFNYLSEQNRSLIKNNINSIIEDYKGNIWFGTQFGLYKYTGDSIYSYFSDEMDAEHSLLSDEITVLYEDLDGIIWVGSSKGVNYYEPSDSDDPNNIAFKVLSVNDESKDIITNNYIYSISSDNQDRVWFGTRLGLVSYNKTLSTYKAYTQEDGLANDLIYGILNDLNGTKWVSTNKGISSITEDGSISNYDLSDGLPGYVYNAKAVSESRDGTLYFGGVDGVAFCHPDSIKINPYRPNVEIEYLTVNVRGEDVETHKINSDEIELAYKQGAIIQISYAALEFTDPLKNKFQIFIDGLDNEWRPVTNEHYVDISDLKPGSYELMIKGSNNDLQWSENMATLKITITPPFWQTNYAYAFYFIAIIFLVQSIINLRVRTYKRANALKDRKIAEQQEVERQKNQLERINKDLNASIKYAKRIQSTILPTPQELRSSLPSHFVYFKPRDIVSGDFYWLHHEGDYVYIAAVDCTGHGVPGAFMSIIGGDILKSVVQQSKEVSPAKILNTLNSELNKKFRKSEKQGNAMDEVSDGMDMSLCIINKKDRSMRFAGAMNGLYLIRDKEMHTYKATRKPIGYVSPDGDEDIFEESLIQLEEDDIFYIFSDGFPDQFGGPNGGKYKIRRFRTFLLGIHNLPMAEQKIVLDRQLASWMGENEEDGSLAHEQVDDILVIGVRPLG